MQARTVAGADGRTWSVRRNIEWKTPATGDEFEHDVDGGRGAVLLILSALFLFWVVLIIWKPPLVHVPWYLWLLAVVILAFFPVRWMARRFTKSGRGRAASPGLCSRRTREWSPSSATGASRQHLPSFSRSFRASWN